MKKLYLGIVFAIEILRNYIFYCTTYIISPINPLKYLMTKQYLLGSVAKWMMLLQEFNINVVK